MDADIVAFGCFLHSKSNSGVTNLADDSQWDYALNRLQKAVEEFNEDHPNEQMPDDVKEKLSQGNMYVFRSKK